MVAPPKVPRNAERGLKAKTAPRRVRTKSAAKDSIKAGAP
jgi:hypothetical protein